MSTVPPCDVVAVLPAPTTGRCVVVVTFAGGAALDVVGGIEPDAAVSVGPGVVGVVDLGRVLEVDVVVDCPRPDGLVLEDVVLEDPAPENDVLEVEVGSVGVGPGRAAGAASSWSIAVCDNRVTSLGATPLATRATAAKARLTATTMPSAQTPASRNPRFTSRFSSTRTTRGHKCAARPRQASPAPPVTTTSPPYAECLMAKVLIVEDDDRVRLPLVHSLTTRGHVVTEAGSGLPALQSIVDEPPDVVLLDLGLPDIDGGDLLKMLRAIERGAVDRRDRARR